MDKLSPKALMKAGLDAQSAAGEKNKDKYKGPTAKEMDRAARMMEADIPPGSSSKLRNTNPMQDMLKGAMAAEEADKQRKEMEKAMLKGASMGGMGPMQGMKKGGKITAANYDKEYGKIYRKAVKKMASGGSTASSRADGIAVKGKTRGKIC
jgi:hypothetical protein